MTDVYAPDYEAPEDARKPLLLGEAPSKAGDRFHHFPLSGRPARVLCEATGIPPQPGGTTYGRWTWALYERFDCRNLIPRYAEATPWRAATARDRAGALLDDLRTMDHEPVIVCLGRKVQAAIADVLEPDALMRPLKGVDPWNRGFFGSFGVWVAPWMVHTPRGSDGGLVARREWAPWVVTLPHPSGLNRLLNDPSVRDRIGGVLRQSLEIAANGATVRPS